MTGAHLRPRSPRERCSARWRFPAATKVLVEGRPAKVDIFLTNLRTSVTVFQNPASRATRPWRLWGSALAAARSQKAVKPLKTNNPAKCSISCPNDLKDLRPALRNRPFRLAKDSFRFRSFLGVVEAQDAMAARSTAAWGFFEAASRRLGTMRSEGNDSEMAPQALGIAQNGLVRG
jgi:hypothetical protein